MSSSSKAARAATRLLPLLLVLLFPSCSRDSSRIKFTPPERERYLQTLDSFRQRKDTLFLSDPSSPLTLEEKKAREVPKYYPANFDLIFNVRLIRDAKPQAMDIMATGGEVRSAVRLGRIDLEIGGKEVSLAVYRMSGDPSNSLFLPFTDRTCGTTSYPGGRYIDLEVNRSDRYIVDFNYCYNPYCAYNHSYSCPIVPAENRLDVEIPAGEEEYR